MKSVLILAKSTFQNLLRDRLLYNVIFIAVFLLLVGYWASLLVYGNQHRVMLHFGILVISLSVFGIAMAAGSKMIVQETESRLIHLILSKPVSRTSYWFGKSLGIGLFLALNLILLMGVLITGVHLTGGTLNITYLQALSLIWVESWMVCNLAMWLSLKLSSSISMMLSMTLLFISHNQSQVRFLKEQGAAGTALLDMLTQLIPNGELFLLDTGVYYDLPLLLGDWSYRFGMGLVWVLIFFMLGNVFFNRKNL
jgi:ABC-type transport system involved in multi-copper enzyme maturation permease subunit